MKTEYTRRLFIRCSGVATLCLAMVGSIPALAQTTAPAAGRETAGSQTAGSDTAGSQTAGSQTRQDQNLPSAAEVIEMNINFMGGRDALGAVTSISSVSTMMIPGPAGEIEATVNLQQSGDKFLMAMNLPGMGEMKQGRSGDVFWMENPVMGPKIIDDGTEQDAIEARFASPFPQLNWNPAEDEISVESKEAVDGVDCYKVKFGDSTSRFYNAQTGQLVKELMTQDSPVGEMTIEVVPGDFREINGIRLPFSNVTSTPQGEMDVEFAEYKINEAIADETFSIPESIQKLLDERKDQSMEEDK